MAGGVRCEVGGGEKRAGEMTGQKLAFGAAHYEQTRLPATTSTGRGLSIRRGWRKRAWGGRQRVHLGDMEQTEKVRGAGGKYVGSLQSRYVGEAKAGKSLLQQRGEWWAREGAHKRAQVPRQRL
jgi:hypothetical protein